MVSVIGELPPCARYAAAVPSPTGDAKSRCAEDASI
jgi:hypothetical protein